jgi:hypothetical protein
MTYIQCNGIGRHAGQRSCGGRLSRQDHCKPHVEPDRETSRLAHGQCPNVVCRTDRYGFRSPRDLTGAGEHANGEEAEDITRLRCYEWPNAASANDKDTILYGYGHLVRHVRLNQPHSFIPSFFEIKELAGA